MGCQGLMRSQRKPDCPGGCQVHTTREWGGEKKLRSGARHPAPRPLAMQPAPLGLSEGWETDPDRKTQVASVRGAETSLSQSCTGPGRSSVGILEGQHDAGTKGSPEL